VELRYRKQPNLINIKKALMSKQIIYYKLVNQKIRNTDNESLSVGEKERWDRQILHPLINQKKIKEARVVVFGLGGIGSNVLMGLIYSGISNFKIVDFDKVTLSNLNRQTLYTPSEISKNKTDIAEKRLLEINPEIKVESINMELDYPEELNVLQLKEQDYPENVSIIDGLIKRGDYIVNAMDYNGAPYLINDLCIRHHKPFYWGGVNHSFGEIFSYYPDKTTACLRCIFGASHFINKIQFLRYKKRGEEWPIGVNVGTTVMITGNFIAEMIIHDACEITNSIHGNYIIFDMINFEILKIPIEIDHECVCKVYH